METLIAGLPPNNNGIPVKLELKLMDRSKDNRVVYSYIPTCGMPSEGHPRFKEFYDSWRYFTTKDLGPSAVIPFEEDKE